VATVFDRIWRNSIRPPQKELPAVCPKALPAVRTSPVPNLTLC
jgi:hypothetical protein